MNEGHFRKLENMYLGAPINRFYSPRLTVFRGEAELVIPIKEEFFHAAGATHGSVYFKAMDDAAFFAVNSLVEDVFVLTANFTIYLTRPIASGEMTSRGKVVHTTTRLFLAEAVLSDGQGREIGRGSGSFMKSTMPLSPELGYK